MQDVHQTQIWVASFHLTQVWIALEMVTGASLQGFLVKILHVTSFICFAWLQKTASVKIA